MSALLLCASTVPDLYHPLLTLSCTVGVSCGPVLQIAELSDLCSVCLYSLSYHSTTTNLQLQLRSSVFSDPKCVFHKTAYLFFCLPIHLIFTLLSYPPFPAQHKPCLLLEALLDTPVTFSSSMPQSIITQYKLPIVGSFKNVLCQLV